MRVCCIVTGKNLLKLFLLEQFFGTQSLVSVKKVKGYVTAVKKVPGRIRKLHVVHLQTPDAGQ